MTIRLFGEGDLAAADELRRLAGWNQTLEDWRRLLALEPQGCFVAVQDGRVIGTVTTTTYGKTLAWIGMMLVHPERRGKGVGTLLMGRALEHLRTIGMQCIKLDATPAGRPLYEKLGFVAESTLARCQRPGGSDASLAEDAFESTRDLSDADWGTIDTLDTVAFGAARSRLLRSLAAYSRSALIWPAQGEVAGWGLLRSGTNADYAGPIVGASNEALLPLMLALLRKAGNRAVIWDVPEQNAPAGRVARQLGFALLRPLTRMRLGPPTSAGEPNNYFAIADPSVG